MRYVLIFLFVFGPVLNRFGNFFDFIFIVSGLVVILNYRNLYILNNNLVNLFYFLFVLYALLSFRILFYSEINFTSWVGVILKPLRIVFTLWAGILISYSIKESGKKFQDLLKMLFVAIVIHSIIMVTQFFNISFRDFIYGFTTTGEFRSSFEYDFRMGGLSGTSGGAILSVVQSLGIILVPFLLSYYNGLLDRILIIIFAILILFSIIVCGRSGIYNSIIFIPISIYLVSGLIKSLKYSVFLSLSLIGLFFLVTEIVLSNSGTDLFYAYNRTFDSFLELSESGIYENDTVDILKDYILFPDLFTFLFGDNDALLNYDMERNLDSDIGYVRNLFSFGLFGFIMFVLPLFFILRYSYLNMESSTPSKLLFILLLIMFLFHAKEGFLYARMFWSVICLVFGWILAENKNYKTDLKCVE
jgi:hypothetical protein